MKKLAFAVLCGLAMVAVGCGASSFGSCTATSSGISYCINYKGSGFNSAAAIQTACTASQGTYSSSDCAAGAGTCTFGAGTTGEFSWVYSTVDAGAGVSLSSICTAAGGTWK